MVVFFLGFFIGRQARGNRFFGAQKRFQSNYFGSLARRGRDADESALSEYVKALVRVDRLDDSELLKTLQRGIANSAREEESIGGLSAFKNVGKPTKGGVLGTAHAPIHMVAAEGGHFKEQLWRTIRTIALGFLLISKRYQTDWAVECNATEEKYREQPCL
ncbi:hypothetical protein ACOSQ3_019432 [Xanthoceras sorbifolium]